MTEKNEEFMALNATKIGVWIAPKLKKLEMIFISISIIGMLLFCSNSDQNIIILNIGLFLLSTLYFFRSFAPIGIFAEPGVDNFMKYIGFWGLSTAIVGILFRISNLPGWNMMLATGCFVLIFFVGFGLYWTKKHDKIKSIYMPIIFRGLIIIILGLLLFFTPTRKLVEIGLVKKISNTESIK